MDHILHSITTEHDARWLLAAGLICVLGLTTALHLLAAARLEGGPKRRYGVVLVALISGLTVFSAHFVALHGYHPGGNMRYAVWLTIGSLALVLSSFGLAAATVMARPTRMYRTLAGAISLAGVIGMQFLGTAGLHLAGAVSWQPGTVALGIGGSLLLALASGGIFYGPGLPRRLATALGGTLAVAMLHLTTMSALVIVPGPETDNGLTVSGAVMAGVVVASVLAIASLAGLVSWTAWASRSSLLKRFREALDAMSDGIALFDAEGRLVLWNSRYAEVNPELSSTLKAGMSFREIIQVGLDADIYADAGGRHNERVQERLDSCRAPITIMEQQIAGDRWLRITDRRTATGGVVTVCTDITDQKNDAGVLAKARDAAQSASSAKSQFLANMSHEIRTPLNGVIGIAHALAKTSLSAQQEEMLELIQSSGLTLQVLLNDILDLARVESGRLELTSEAFHLGRAVREAARLYESSAQMKGLQFFVEITPEADGWIVGDVVRIKQVLTNLVSNAVKFTDAGSVILTVAVGPEQAGVQTLRFSVEDSGMGFDSETRDRLFSRFEQADGAITRRFGGSGLGLAISRQLAEIMEGNLDCESEPGGGSAFILTIPFNPADAPATVADVIAEGPDDEGTLVRVLLADDHPVNRKVVEMILAQANVDLTSVENGAQAVQACRDSDFDIVLMDMQMPVMDGLTATREIRLHEAAMGLARTPIVMLTANALAEHIASAEAAGADRHVAKPFEAAELLRLVATLPRAATARQAA